MSKRLPFKGESIDVCLMATILHDLKEIKATMQRSPR